MFLKVCCIATPDEASRAIAAGARAVGLVSSMPSGPGVIEEALIAEIARSIPPAIESWLLTSRTDADAIAEQHARCGTSAVQLTDALARTEEYARLRRLLPDGVRIVQVIHVLDEASVLEARAAAAHVDAILLDSGNPRLATKELGGTGRVHDWTLSAAIRASVPVPVLLAGGLRAENVRAAIAAVRPFGIDVCSGVRRDGALAPERLASFTAEVRAGFASLQA
jgi:phosphoribosylanthranilate isomerase